MEKVSQIFNFRKNSYLKRSIMNIKEVSEALGIAESTLKNNYKRGIINRTKRQINLSLFLNIKSFGIKID